MRQAVASIFRLSREERLLVTLGAVFCVAVALAYNVMGFPVIRSDIKGYINWSHHLSATTQHWVGFHLPGWPALIALSRVLTLGLVGDTVLIQGLAFVCWVVSLRFVSLILDELSPKSKAIGLLIFGLYPFVGISLVVYPLADILANLLLTGALYYALRKSRWPFVLFVAYGLLVHKALWPFMFLLALVVCFLRRGMAWWHFALTGVPLTIYCLTMTPVVKDPLWIFRFHLERELTSHGILPIFDGILGTMMEGSMQDLFKGGVLLLVFMIALFLALYFLRRREWLFLTLIVPVLLLAVTLNQHEAWALLRFSKVLVIPLCVWLATQTERTAVFHDRFAYVGMATLLIVTNLVWAVYITIFYGFNPA